MSITIAPGRLREAALVGQQLAEGPAIELEQRSSVGDVVGHTQNVAADQLRMLVQIGVGHDQRVLDDLARRTGKQPVEAAIEVTLATIATSTAGSTAMMENRLTIWMCSRAAARPRRRACTTCQTSRTMMPTSSRMVAALISRNE